MTASASADAGDRLGHWRRVEPLGDTGGRHAGGGRSGGAAGTAAVVHCLSPPLVRAADGIGCLLLTGAVASVMRKTLLRSMLLSDAVLLVFGPRWRVAAGTRRSTLPKTVGSVGRGTARLLARGGGSRPFR